MKDSMICLDVRNCFCCFVIDYSLCYFVTIVPFTNMGNVIKFATYIIYLPSVNVDVVQPWWLGLLARYYLI